MQRLPVDLDLDRETKGLALTDYLGVFARRIWFIIIPFMLLLGLGTALAFLVTPQHRASTSFELVDSADIDRELSRSVGGFINVKSRNAHVRPEIMRRSFLQPLVTKNGINEGFDVSSGKGREKLFEHIFKSLDVSLVSSNEAPDIVTISYRGRDPVKITNFVNDIRQAYCRLFIEQLRTEVDQNVRTARSRHQMALREVETAANLEAEHNRTYGIVGDPKVHAGLRNQNFEELRGRRDAALGRVKSKRLEHDEVKKRLLEERPLIPGSRQTDVNPAYRSKADEIKRKEEEIAKLLQAGNTEAHPFVVMARRDLKSLGEELAKIPETLSVSTSEVANKTFDLLRDQEAKLAVEIHGLEGEIELLNQAIAKESAVLAALPEASMLSQKLAVDLRNAQEHLRRVHQSMRTGEAMLERVNSDSIDFFRVIRSTLVEDAVHQSPVFPNVPMFIGVGGFVGLLVGIGLAFLVEFSTSSFVTIGQVQRTISIPMLGYVQRIESQEETRRRRTRRLVSWSLLGALVLVLAIIHLAYFNKDWQVHLPPWLFDSLKRIYGAR